MQPMLAREAADFKTSRQKSTEQKIGNLFSGKCGPRARAQSRHQTTKNKWYLRKMSPDDRSNP
jgi:hypothetical protein